MNFDDKDLFDIENKIQNLEPSSADEMLTGKVDKKIKILIAEEELRKKQEKERALNLERVRNQTFQKKLEKIRTELEYKELQKQAKIRQVKMLELENDNMKAEEQLLDELRESALEMLKGKNDNSVLDSIAFNDSNEDDELEYRKRELQRELLEKKEALREKNEEITRIINLSELKK